MGKGGGASLNNRSTFELYLVIVSSKNKTYFPTKIASKQVNPNLALLFVFTNPKSSLPPNVIPNSFQVSEL